MVMFTIEKHQKINERWFTTKISEKPTDNDQTHTCTCQNPHPWPQVQVSAGRGVCRAAHWPFYGYGHQSVAINSDLEIQMGRVGHKTAVNGSYGRLHTVQKNKDFSHFFPHFWIHVGQESHKEQY